MSKQAPQAQLSGVSLVMPVRDEFAHLSESVGAALAQDYAGPLQLVIALGPSADGTEAIAQRLAAADDRIVLVDNPSGRTPNGLNLAIAKASHDVVVRVDGHAVLPPDYVRVAVDVLDQSGADNVGGVMAAVGVGPFERAVAAAMRSRLGVGSASFHIGGQEGPALTVYLGAFRRAALDRVGGYDESMTRAQDWEMNHRIRETGGIVWFTPRLGVTYRPRSTVGRLARQYFDYGRWRREVMRRHPETVSARYLAAPVMVAGVSLGTAVGLVGLIGPQLALAGFVAPIGYLALIGIGGLAVGAGLDIGARTQVPVALATMHWSWGIGFLTSRST